MGKVFRLRIDSPREVARLRRVVEEKLRNIAASRPREIVELARNLGMEVELIGAPTVVLTKSQVCGALFVLGLVIPLWEKVEEYRHPVSGQRGMIFRDPRAEAAEMVDECRVVVESVDREWVTMSVKSRVGRVHTVSVSVDPTKAVVTTKYVKQSGEIVERRYSRDVEVSNPDVLVYAAEKFLVDQVR